MKTLEVINLRAKYEKAGPEVLKGIHFDLDSDDFLAIIGPSGAGKSTLIRCINRLVDPTSGDVVFNGVNVTQLNQRELRKVRRQMGMISQESRPSPARGSASSSTTPTPGASVAYDRVTRVGPLDKALDEAIARGWAIVDMKADWKRMFPFEER